MPPARNQPRHATHAHKRLVPTVNGVISKCPSTSPPDASRIPERRNGTRKKGWLDVKKRVIMLCSRGCQAALFSVFYFLFLRSYIAFNGRKMQGTKKKRKKKKTNSASTSNKNKNKTGTSRERDLTRKNANRTTFAPTLMWNNRYPGLDY